jgi:hypothetical protein
MIIYNVDDSDFQFWAHKRNLSVIAPADFSGDKVKIPVERTAKRSCLVSGIFAAGYY